MLYFISAWMCSIFYASVTVIFDAECPFRDQASLNNTKLQTPYFPGDIRNILKTVSGLQNPEHSKKEVKKLRFLVNDIDPDILARDILLLEIIHSLDVEKVYIVTSS